MQNVFIQNVSIGNELLLFHSSQKVVSTFQIKLPNISQRVCSCVKEMTILLNGGLHDTYMYIGKAFIILHVLLPFSFALERCGFCFFIDKYK